jgi:hydroxymethylpyrimidine pyrophosphatase-like HAD family hydrolase
MKIVFDMDNTLTDGWGTAVRPGMVDLLRRLKTEGHTLVVWTNSPRVRARQVLSDLNLRTLFGEFLFREDYDPDNAGKPKDIRTIGGDFLVDDDPKQIEFVKSAGKRGFLITSYWRQSTPSPAELERLYKAIQKARGLFARLFS